MTLARYNHDRFTNPCGMQRMLDELGLTEDTAEIVIFEETPKQLTLSEPDVVSETN